MDAIRLIGKHVRAVELTLVAVSHPAVDALQGAQTALEVRLEFASGEQVYVSPVEVDLGGSRYPAMGLACSEASTLHRPNWVRFEAPHQAAGFLFRVEASDPVGEQTATQLALFGEGSALYIRHVSPMVLAVWAGSVGSGPNNSSKPTPLRGAA